MAEVMVTGASGFVGVHVVRRLLDDGHRVRALVRTPARLRHHLAMLGVDADDAPLDVVRGDMTDADSVRGAVSGCDQAVHAAATFSYLRADAERMLRENVVGTTTVLDAAIEAGCSTVVHVSSIIALARPGATLDHRSPLGIPIGPYSRSKIDSEREARARQEAGHPVAIVYPGAVLGPHDPYLGETDQALRDVLRGRLPTWPRGGLQWVDVRDVAEVVVAALDRPGGRYLVPGENVALPHETLRVLTGRRLPAVRVPVPALVPVLEVGYRSGLSFLPHTLEAARAIALDSQVDATETVEELGVTGRPLRESMADTVRWMAEAGHISQRQAGRCLEPR